jgi:hypothetical protein
MGSAQDSGKGSMNSFRCISGEALGEETLFSFRVANSENIIYIALVIAQKIRKDKKSIEGE